MIYNHMQWKENGLLRNRKRFYYSNGDNKVEGDFFKTIWVHWTHESGGKG